MMRSLAYALPLLLAVTDPVIAANQPVAELKKSVISVLDSVDSSQVAGTLSMELDGADSNRVKIGSEISLVFGSNRNCFVSIFWVESGGDINLIKAWRHEEPLTANGDLKKFPDPSIGALEATPPLGKDALYAFCTVHKPAFSNISFTDGYAWVSVKDAVIQIPKLISELSSDGEIVATSKILVNIVGRENSVFSEQDIVENFRGPSKRRINRSVLAVPVQFNVGSDRIGDSAIEMLNNIGRAFTSAELNQSKFRINGHTDATGSDAYNDDLSERRAISVKTYLSTKFNIAPSRLEVVGWGENMAKSDNSTAEGRAENRRVEFELLD